jgi:hypothetical protein
MAAILGSHGNRVIAIASLMFRGIPTMCLKETPNVGLAVQLNVISGLMYIKPIVLVVDTTRTEQTNTLVKSGDARVDVANQQLSSGLSGRSDGEVIDLATHENSVTVDGATIQVVLVSGRVKTKFLEKDTNDHAFL